MPNSPDFVTYAVELLSDAGPVQARRMFGGHGIFHGGLMVALIDDDELFLKADEEARGRFEEAGCQQWRYSGAKGTTPMPYWRPPDEAHESPEAMRPWALLAGGGGAGAAAKAAPGKGAAAAAEGEKAAAQSRRSGRCSRPGASPGSPGGSPRPGTRSRPWRSR